MRFSVRSFDADKRISRSLLPGEEGKAGPMANRLYGDDRVRIFECDPSGTASFFQFFQQQGVKNPLLIHARDPALKTAPVDAHEKRFA